MTHIENGVRDASGSLTKLLLTKHKPLIGILRGKKSAKITRAPEPKELTTDENILES